MGNDGGEGKNKLRDMNILSLFDGMSCGQIALSGLGVSIDNYYACEIDKHAMKASSTLFPNTIHLGDVTNVSAKDLPRIDLLIGGSPCQGFSFAGKQLAFDDPRSKLFFEFVRIWEEVKSINPNARFLLENVKMKKEHEVVISQFMGVTPITINSALVSAQNRVRLYWTNINSQPQGLFGFDMCMIPQPQDRGILLKDILESDVMDKYYLSEKIIHGFIKHTNNIIEKGNGFFWNPTEGDKKGNCVTSRCYKMGVDDNYILIPEATKKGYTEILPGECFDFENPKSETRRGRKMEDKSNCLMAKETDFMQYTSDYKIRRLTPRECLRLQTIPEAMIDKLLSSGISDTQLYRMAGNGWTVEVIKHILKYFTPC